MTAPDDIDGLIERRRQEERVQELREEAAPDDIDGLIERLKTSPTLASYALVQDAVRALTALKARVRELEKREKTLLNTVAVHVAAYQALKARVPATPGRDDMAALAKIIAIDKMAEVMGEAVHGGDWRGFKESVKEKERTRAKALIAHIDATRAASATQSDTVKKGE